MNTEKAKKQAREIVSKMTVEEKISQLVYNSPAIERLGIHEYNWWNEALHGVARSGLATVFPQAIALAATMNPALVKEIAEIISTEARAKYNKYCEFGDRDIYKGLTFWSPNINIFRDPRWGRGHETYGEDPYLTSEMAKAFISGIQGDGEYLKAGACAKHFAVHSGPENLRHSFDATVTPKELGETYLPAFEECVKAGVAGVMGAYNRTNGEACCASDFLMNKLLEWGFDGYFVSDCGAIADIYEGHKIVKTASEAAALALNAGCDLNCGSCYEALYDAYEEDLTDEEAITRSAEKLFTIRCLLGEFEEKRPFSDIPYEKVDCRQHREKNCEAARQCLVLLENKDGALPLDPSKKLKIGIVGPNAMSSDVLRGNYNGTPSGYVTVADGMKEVFSGCDILVSQGSGYFGEAGKNELLSDGLSVASVSDVTVLCLGLTGSLEGEEGEGGDKNSIVLPAVQRELGEKVCEVCDNVIVVLMTGSSLDLGEKLREKAKAILFAPYPGALGGMAVAEAIGGKFSPSGRLPFTFYSGDYEIPDFTDYSMKDRTYAHITKQPLWSFGHGLSYSDVVYSPVHVVADEESSALISVDIENKGGYDLLEKVLVFASFNDSRTETPNCRLCAVAPTELKAGEKKTVTLSVDKKRFCLCDDSGRYIIPDGEIKYYTRPVIKNEI